MIRLLHLEITDVCDDCPYYDVGWNSCGESSREIGPRKDKFPLIPDWCPLPEYIEGGKF